MGCWHEWERVSCVQQAAGALLPPACLAPAPRAARRPATPRTASRARPRQRASRARRGRRPARTWACGCRPWPPQSRPWQHPRRRRSSRTAPPCLLFECSEERGRWVQVRRRSGLGRAARRLGVLVPFAAARAPPHCLPVPPSSPPPPPTCEARVDLHPQLLRFLGQPPRQLAGEGGREGGRRGRRAPAKGLQQRLPTHVARTGPAAGHQARASPLPQRPKPTQHPT
jgi:hypothetical protein